VSIDQEKRVAAAKATAIGHRGFGYVPNAAYTCQPRDVAAIRLIFAAIEIGAKPETITKFLDEIASTRHLETGRNND
jgi:hypothetical protein